MDSIYKKTLLPHIILTYTQRLIPGRTFEEIGNLGILTLASQLCAKGFHARAFCGIATDIANIIQNYKEKLFAVCFYCDYDNQTVVRSLCRELKQFNNFLILIGGPQAYHMTFQDLELFSADAIICGDGEEVLPNYLLSRYEGKACKMPQVIDFMNTESAIPDILSDYSQYALPDNYCNLIQNNRNPLITVISARGCPHRCAFCFEGGCSKDLRIRPENEVLHELEIRLSKVKNKKSYVFFADDTFTISALRLEKILAGLRELRKKYDFLWFCEGHAKFLVKHQDFIDEMVESGLVRMQIGMESGNQNVLDAYKKNISPDDIFAVAKRAYQASLPQLAGNFIIGGAYETIETLNITTEFVLQMMEYLPGLLDISTTFPMFLPCTQLSKTPEIFGLEIVDPDNICSNEDYPVSKTLNLSVNQICTQRYDFLASILEKMSIQFEQKKIQKWRIVNDFKLAKTIGLVSSHLRFVYSKNLAAKAYFSSLASNCNLRQWQSLSAKERLQAIPLCTVPLKDIDLSDLNSNELSLLLHCSGRNVTQLAIELKTDIKNIQNMLERLANDYYVLFLIPV